LKKEYSNPLTNKKMNELQNEIEALIALKKKKVRKIVKKSDLKLDEFQSIIKSTNLMLSTM